MTNNKVITALVVVILAMGLIVYLHQRSSRPAVGAEIGKLVFPKLKDGLDNIQEVKFSSSDQTTTINHNGKHWIIAEKGDYEVDFGKLSSFLDGLAKAKYVERKTSKPANFSILGVLGVDDSASKAVNVSISTSNGSRYTLLIGNKSQGQKGRFVRKPDQSQVWLVDNIDDVTSDPLKWIEPVILSIDSDEVTSVTDVSADGKPTLSVDRQKGSDGFVIKDLPKNAKLNYPTIADSPSRALENVRATDVRARGSHWQHAASAHYAFKDGSSLVVRARQDKAGEHWLRFNLTLSKKPSEDLSFISPSRLSGFEFKVAGYTFSQFTQTMDDMIKKEPPASAKTSTHAQSTHAQSTK